MTSTLHASQPTGEIHIPYNWTYANTAAREGATGLVSGDVGKFCRQTDDNSIWMLTATTPTWTQVNAAGSGITTSTDTVANRPAASGVGNLFFPSNGFHIERDTGAAWGAAWGPLFPMTRPVLGDFTWVNQGSGTAVDLNGGIYLEAPALAGDNIKGLVKNVPGASYTIDIAFIQNAAPVAHNGCGLLLYDGTKLVTFGIKLQGAGGAELNTINIDKWSDATHWAANYNETLLWRTMLWFMRLRDTGTNRICSISYDGVNFRQIHTVGNTDYLTPTKVGFYAASINASNLCGINLLSWKES